MKCLFSENYNAFLVKNYHKFLISHISTGPRPQALVTKCDKQEVAAYKHCKNLKKSIGRATNECQVGDALSEKDAVPNISRCRKEEALEWGKCEWSPG